MSEAQMSVEGRQQLATMRERLVEENAQHETHYSLVGLGIEDIADLAGGYVNLKVRAMANLMLSTEDQDQRRAARSPKKTKKP